MISLNLHGALVSFLRLEVIGRLVTGLLVADAERGRTEPAV